MKIENDRPDMEGVRFTFDQQMLFRITYRFDLLVYGYVMRQKQQ